MTYSRLFAAYHQLLERFREPVQAPGPDVLSLRQQLPLGKQLAVDLKDHQIAALSWLMQHAPDHAKRGVILADDMGLGKTLTSLAWLSMRLAAGERALVVAPTSLIQGWKDEANRWTQLTSCSWPDQHAQIQLITYDGLIRHQQALRDANHDVVIFDEAQALKNPRTHRHQAAHSLPGQRIALTGTPIENSLHDLWALLDLTSPAEHGSEQQFVQHMRSYPAHLTQHLATRLLQRMKADISDLNLPVKNEWRVACPMSASQRQLYDQLQHAPINGGQDVLRLLTKLKRACDDLRLAGAADPGGATSGKLAWLKVQMTHWQAPAIVFSQYRGMLDILQTELEGHGWEIYRIDGSMPARSRNRELKRWRASSSPRRLFLISLRAGGCGLTLTEATRVVHFDRWWNPAVEAQASDRIYRIGQTKDVHIYQLVSDESLEEKIDLLLVQKRVLAGLIRSQPGISSVAQLLRESA